MDWAPVNDSVIYQSPLQDDPTPVRFEHPGWSFWLDDNADWAAKMDAAFAREKHAYVDRVHAAIEKYNEVLAATNNLVAGLALIPVAAGNSGRDWHVSAFVQYQVGGIPKSKIKTPVGRSGRRRKPGTVDLAVKSVAQKAPMTLRADMEQDGRPIGSRDQAQRRRAR